MSATELGELVRKRRKRLGLSQAEAAVLAGVGSRLVYEVEHGSQSVQLDKLIRLLNTLGLHVAVRPGAADSVVVEA
jgi:HTH-type transcriptional regulator/antitoxin HipB